MSITTTLPGFPLINQLQAPTADGQVDENARENCVPASLAAALTYLTGIRFEPDALKDAVYGQGYTGVQSAAQYVPFCASQGVALHLHSGTQANLIATIRGELAAGHPVLVTMPSQWSTAPSDPVHPQGYTHVGVMCGYGPGTLRCMNPWGGFWQDEEDAWWQARLCFGEVWPLCRVAEQLTTLNARGVSPVSTAKPRTWPGIGSGLTEELNSENLPSTYRVLVNEQDGGAIPGRPDEIVVVVGDNNTDRIAAWNRKLGRVERNWGGHILRSYIARVQALEAQVKSQQTTIGALNTQLAKVQAELKAATSSAATSTSATPTPTPTIAAMPTLESATPEQLISAFVRALARTWSTQQATRPLPAAVTTASK